MTAWVGAAVAHGQVFTENYVLLSPMVRLGLRADGLSPALAAAAPVAPPWTMTPSLAVVARVSVLLGLFPRTVLDLVDPLIGGR